MIAPSRTLARIRHTAGRSGLRRFTVNPGLTRSTEASGSARPRARTPLGRSLALCRSTCGAAPSWVERPCIVRPVYQIARPAPPHPRRPTGAHSRCGRHVWRRPACAWLAPVDQRRMRRN
jgi:hypothetical protein